ncbi:hypothetical protein HOD82_02680, partial [bacterium]|nr:hypothetical protein [bacterium]
TTTSGYLWKADVCGGEGGDQWTVSGTGDDLGASVRAVAEIDGVWASADTTAVRIDGWTTDSDNHIKVYTTDLARHDGRWNDGKYRMVRTSIGTYQELLDVRTDYVVIDGLQIHVINNGFNSTAGISAANITNSSNKIEISNNIIKGTITGNDAAGLKSYSVGTIFEIWNNVIYDFDYNGSEGVILSNVSSNAYNNTFYNCYYGFYGEADDVLKNNIVQNSTNGYYGTFDLTSDYNISDVDATDAPNDTFTDDYATVTFVDAASDDFHLSASDTGAMDVGADLSSDANLNFTTDIDGDTRPGTKDFGTLDWDIGADEYFNPTPIYRSVGPANTSTLATDSSHANTVTLSSGVATFSTALADNIGVGDVVIIDTAGTDQTIDSADTLLFISSRTSSTVYTFQTESGAVPSDIAVNDTYSIYRAYTSLSNAEAGTENTTITGLGFSFTGGNRDLVTNNEQWNLTCYGDAVDITSVDIDGWTTGVNNYIKVYTPVSSDEVGTSQRHNGVWDDGKYRREIAASGYTYALRISDPYIRIVGLQTLTTGITAYDLFGIYNDSGENSEVIISDNIIKSTGTGRVEGIRSHYSAYIFNNIIYDQKDVGINISSYKAGTIYAYNNTVYNSAEGINRGSTDNILVAKNNVVQNCADGYFGTFDSSSDFNISDVIGDTTGLSDSYRSGLATEVSFIDEAGDDFHLLATDTLAKDQGTDLSVIFTDDIDGQGRMGTWDIGADETSNSKKQLRGNIELRGTVKFR